jgi:lysophospholipase L1-like esterase
VLGISGEEDDDGNVASGLNDTKKDDTKKAELIKKVEKMGLNLEQIATYLKTTADKLTAEQIATVIAKKEAKLNESNTAPEKT